MGFFRRKIKNPIVGTAQITSCSAPGNPRAIRSTCVLFVIVEGPGLVPTSHEIRRQVRVARWPHPGMTLPCRVDPKDHARFEIDFNSIPDWQDKARVHAAQTAAVRASGRRGPVATGMSAGGMGGVTVIGAGSVAEAEEAVRKAEGALGMDLDNDGHIG